MTPDPIPVGPSYQDLAIIGFSYLIFLIYGIVVEYLYYLRSTNKKPSFKIVASLNIFTFILGALLSPFLIVYYLGSLFKAWSLPISIIIVEFIIILIEYLVLNRVYAYSLALVTIANILSFTLSLPLDLFAFFNFSSISTSQISIYSMLTIATIASEGLLIFFLYKKFFKSFSYF